MWVKHARARQGPGPAGPADGRLTLEAATTARDSTPVPPAAWAWPGWPTGISTVDGKLLVESTPGAGHIARRDPAAGASDD